MQNTGSSSDLITAIADLEEERALALVRQRLEAEDPLSIMEDCQEGLRRVGERYERGQYFLAGLIMGGEIFRQVMEMAQPEVERTFTGAGSGRVLLGTVEGDIHDLGKMIVNMLLSCHGFTVYDLGVDVPPATFVAQAKELEPDVVGLSGLLTSSYETMRETVASLREGGCKASIIIGGGQLGEEICRHVGADYWTTDAVTGVELCQRLVKEVQESRAGSVTGR